MPLYNSFVKLLALIPIFVLKDVIKWAKFPRNRYLDGNFLLSLPSEGATLCAPSGDVPDGRYPRRWESAEFPILDLRDCSFPRRCSSAIRLSIREIASSFSFSVNPCKTYRAKLRPAGAVSLFSYPGHKRRFPPRQPSGSFHRDGHG